MFAKNYIGRKPFTCMGYGLFFFSFAVKVRIITVFASTINIIIC